MTPFIPSSRHGVFMLSLLTAKDPKQGPTSHSTSWQYLQTPPNLIALFSLMFLGPLPFWR